jgi:hypothetical protein
MDVLTTILTCSLYLADDDLVRAIATSTSQSNPYFVLDSSVDWTQVDPPPTPKSAAEAVARASEILSKGGRPLLGLLEVPPRWMSAFGRGLGAAFDPCTNVAVGTAMLSEFDFECSAEGMKKSARARAGAAPGPSGARSAARRRCVLGKYEAAIGSPDFAVTTTLELRSQRTAHPCVEASPIFAPAREPRWGPDELFVSPSPSLPIAQPSDP